MWWKKKPEVKEIDALHELEAVKEFIRDISIDLKQIVTSLGEFEELEKELRVAKGDLTATAIEAQAAAIIKLKESYEFLQNDIDVNGQRIKMIYEQFIRNAERAGLNNLVDKIKEKKTN